MYHYNDTIVTIGNICFSSLIIYFNQIFCSKLRQLIWYCLEIYCFSDIPLYYYNLNSSIICCLFSGDIYLSFGISISFSFLFECNSFEAFGGDFEILLILPAILLPVK